VVCDFSAIRRKFATTRGKSNMSFWGGGSSSGSSSNIPPPPPLTSSGSMDAKNQVIQRIREEANVSSAQMLIEV
jgi:hypothetical protein